ncbi:hypothetical protein [Pantanalinema sp. GBBB05]|uniref:hypothetical protein n=1 Tax=Pantanalinema sp. GBBB05 TaxID=2604139 RepID=UPI001D1F6FF5|nr:hypothetical protein [Pantanalinema sp. GBBB05]
MKTWICILIVVFSLLFSMPQKAMAASSCAPLNIRLSTSQDFEIPINNGKGCAEGSVFNPTWLSTIKGTGNVVSPEAGTWTIEGKAGGKSISFKSASNIAINDAVEWEAQAQKFWRNAIRFDVSWSKNENTTLKIHLNANL